MDQVKMVDAPKRPKVPALAEYVAGHEDKAQPHVVTLISHPDADGTVFQGRYSGIRTAKGKLFAVYSDGSKH